MLILSGIFICTVILRKNVLRAEETTETTTNIDVMANKLRDGAEWINDGLSNVVESISPISDGANLFEGRTMCKRKKHHKQNKFLVPLLVGFLLIKSILLPMALKALAVLSGKAVVLSLMSLILAAIVGLRRVAQGTQGPTGFSYDGYGNSRRKDHFFDDRNNLEDDDPYRYYRDRR